MATTSALAERIAQDPFFRNFRNASIGFDRLFENMIGSSSQEGYPPYNILHVGNDYRIEVALAGFKKPDLKLTCDGGYLILESVQNPPQSDNCRIESQGKLALSTPVDYVHRGISKRYFCLKFRLSDQVELESAKMEDGILTIKLREVKKEMTSNRIEIQ